ncbi:hypothetical protein H0W80_03535 [Candidatus Saccharibacteria bacterium]|nr:hypothetical protein [Candidatus Saccharibacteria bacterium]
MDTGISFDEACSRTPDALTKEQLANCPGVTTTTEWTIYVFIGLIILVMIGVVIFAIKKKTKK